MHPNPVLPSHGPLTLENAIRVTAKAFTAANLDFGHGTDNALDEASWLLMFALGLPVDTAPDYQQEIRESARQRCNDLIDRRMGERIPLAYLTGTAWFAGHEFLCDERALVPRSPLAEFIVADFFGLFQDPGSVIPKPPLTILDLCTGGGCIGISCALAVPEATVVCSDLSKEALALAQANVAKHELQGRVQLIESNLFDNISGRFDLIISNPPYVDAADIASMPDEFHAEPLMGLEAGIDGLDLVRVMMRDAPNHLSDRGWMVVEVGNSQPAMEQAYPNAGLTWLEFSYGGHGIFAVPAANLEPKLKT